MPEVEIKGYLGYRQRACLRGLVTASEGAWYLVGDPPLWGTRTETAIAMRSLVRRGLVTEERQGVFIITPWARVAFCDHPGDRRDHRTDRGTFDWHYELCLVCQGIRPEHDDDDGCMTCRDREDGTGPGHEWLGGLMSASPVVLMTRTKRAFAVVQTTGKHAHAARPRIIGYARTRRGAELWAENRRIDGVVLPVIEGRVTLHPSQVHRHHTLIPIYSTLHLEAYSDGAYRWVECQECRVTLCAPAIWDLR